jgi:hypothetical protein
VDPMDDAVRRCQGVADQSRGVWLRSQSRWKVCRGSLRARCVDGLSWSFDRNRRGARRDGLRWSVV